jgi:hypothetical protein
MADLKDFIKLLILVGAVNKIKIFDFERKALLKLVALPGIEPGFSG